MEPDKKAKELIEKFLPIVKTEKYLGLRIGFLFDFETMLNNDKIGANIVVNEALKEHCHESEFKNPIAQDRWITYWLEVRTEIEKYKK